MRLIKNTRRVFGIAIMLLAALLAGCSVRPGTASDAQPLRILCFMKTEGDTSDVWRQIYNGLRDAIGKSSKYTISVYTYDETNYLTQLDRISCALLIKPDVVLLSSGRSDEFAARLSELDDAGIGYIILDGKDLPGTNRLGFISSDNLAAGFRALEVLADRTGAPLRIGLVNAGYHSQSVNDREDSFRSAVAMRPNSVIVDEVSAASQGSLLENIENVQSLLERNPQINALFCSDSVAGQAAADVLRESGLSGTVHLVCFDTNEFILSAIEDGVIDATMMQKTYGMGQLCLEILENPDGPKIYHTECAVITRDNLETAR